MEAGHHLQPWGAAGGDGLEDVLDPELPIIDPHHHIWSSGPMRYEPADLAADVQSGHNVRGTVFVECRTNYRADGPDAMKPIGETAYIAGLREDPRWARNQPPITAIVAHANLAMGAPLEAVLTAHEAAAEGLFRGVRHIGAFDETGAASPAYASTPCPYPDPSFRQGVRTLGQEGYSFDAWHFFTQNTAFLELARAAPDTAMVLNHAGSPVGVGRYAGREAEVYAKWAADIVELSKCDNVFVKLGGLAMPFVGLRWPEGRAVNSDWAAEAFAPYLLHCIDCFGPSRCMFESNFPVDRMKLSYRVLWNAFKMLAQGYSESERSDLFFRTAAKFYRISIQ